MCYTMFNTPVIKSFLRGISLILLKIFSAEAKRNKVSEAPGTVGAASEAGLPIAASDGYVILKDVQLAGKKRMLISDFLRGYHLKLETVLQ